jgi:GLPGLI family protein
MMAILSFATGRAQDFQGMAVYESNTSTSEFRDKVAGNSQITPEMQKMIQDRMHKMFEKTFILYFDKTTSLYEEEEKLEAPGNEAQGRSMRMMASFTGGGGKHYKNVKTKTFAIEKEMMGKEFLVKDSLPKLQWKMTGETKQIGNYTCFKATATQAAPKTDFRNFKPKKENPDDKKISANSEKPKATNFFDQGEMPKEIEVVAWYAPEIPVGQGPENYWGLPGLILEITSGKTTMLCSKIVMNPKDKKKIEAPTKGKVVSQAEFDDIVVKKMEEMQQMYQQRGSGNGRGNQMRIGG